MTQRTRDGTSTPVYRSLYRNEYMKLNKRTTRLLSIECAQCGSCCGEPMIELTHHDLHRLVDNVNLPAEKLVKLYDNSELNPGEDNDWIYLSYGRRKMGLRKKRNGECIFLSERRQCAAYEARPIACRSFPVDVMLDENNKFIDLELSDIIKTKFIRCKHTHGKPRSFNKFRQIARQAQSETVSYWETLKRWNGLQDKGAKSDFLKFLKL